jgi:hypothetical protein
MLCEFCYEGKWTRFRRRVFEVVRLAQLSLVGCAESVVWSFEHHGGVMLSNALARGVEMAQRRISWASSGCEASESLESFLRARVLEKAFEPAEFGRACRRLLREGEGLIVGKEKSAEGLELV